VTSRTAFGGHWLRKSALWNFNLPKFGRGGVAKTDYQQYIATTKKRFDGDGLHVMANASGL